jgi:tetratricopeptide (TPR) repeat protein
MEDFRKIQNLFQEITGFQLRRRATNFLSERVIRKDNLLEKLSRLYFENPKKFNKISKKILPLINLKKTQSETLLALAGYFYYIQENFQEAKNYFLKCIQLNPKNLDNWFDLAFALRHLGEYELSEGILFNFDYIIYYFELFKLKACNFPKLKKLILTISNASLRRFNQGQKEIYTKEFIPPT